jgi:hypothetical protein
VRDFEWGLQRDPGSSFRSNGNNNGDSYDGDIVMHNGIITLGNPCTVQSGVRRRRNCAFASCI